jgi:hypothetical protein
MMEQQKYGIQKKDNYSIQYKRIQIILDLVEMVIILSQVDLKKLFRYGKQGFMIV